MMGDELEALADIYAIGALDGDDLARFETHLGKGCDRCTALVRQAEHALTRLGLEGAPVTPPDAVRAALLRRAGQRAATRRRLRAGAVAAAWAIAAIGIIAVAVTVRENARLRALAREIVAARAQLRTAERTLADEIAAAELLRDPATQIVELHGVGATPGASARVVWRSKGGGRLYVANLPAPPTGKTYQLWALDDIPRAAVTFDVDARGSANRAIAIAAPSGTVTIRRFEVTVEPDGGALAPTGPTVLSAE